LAFGAAGLFALHPIHSESVAWIAAVTDLELTFFYLLAFWFFLKLEGASGRRLVWTYLAMVGSFGLALLSKEQAVTLPFLAMVYEHFYREDRQQTTWNQKVARYRWLWLLAIAYIPLRLFSLGGFVVVSNYWGLTRQQVILSALSLTGQYLGKLLWPVNLCAFYVFNKNINAQDPSAIAGMLSVVLLCVAFWWLWQKARRVTFGLLWLMVTLAPVLNPKWLGVNVFAERYLYLPSVGFCWVLAWGLKELWSVLSDRHIAWRRSLATAMILVAGLCSVRIATRNRDWKDDVTLYSQTLEDSPDANLIRVNLGASHQRQGFWKEAEDEYREALQRDPECIDCLIYLGALCREQDRDTEAMKFLTRAIQLEPRSAAAHLDLGAVYQHAGRSENAGQQFHQAVTLAPEDPHVYARLGAFYLQQNDPAHAEEAFRRAILINPFQNQARIALAKLCEADRPAEAIQEFQAALRNEPGNVEAILALRRLKAPQE
jgi:tetratricopeptide (TPR) repeat protein